MSTEATIRAAIARLEQLSQQADESYFRFEMAPNQEVYLGPLAVDGFPDPASIQPQTANLIVALYGTIDAQLALLHAAIDEPYGDVVEPEALQKYAFAVATGILGGQIVE